MLSLRGVVKAIALPLVALVLSGSPGSALAQDTTPQLDRHDRDQRGTDLRLPSLRESAQVNDHTIGVSFDGAPELQKALLELDDEVAFHGGLRIVSIVSDSPLQSLYDLLFLRGVDAAIIRSDVVEYVARHGGYASVRNVVNSMARLGHEKIVLVSSRDITSLEELQGKIVSLGERSSGAHLSGAVLLAAAGIEAVHRYLPPEEALEQLDSGEIDAMLHLIPFRSEGSAVITGQDSSADESTEPALSLSATESEAGSERLETAHVLPIEVSPELARVYRLATLSSDDLPGLIDPRTQINTLAVDTILAAYRWRPDNVRYEDMERFAEAFVQGTRHIRAYGPSPFWSEVNLQAEVNGVVRLPVVDTVIERLAAEAAAARQRRVAEARQSRIDALNDRRTRILARMSEKASSADDVELQRLLDELDDFLEALER